MDKSEPLMEAFSIGLRDDPDTSLHEVCLHDTELEKLDKEFNEESDSESDSDLAESDSTITESPGRHSSCHEQGLDEISMPTCIDSSEFDDADSELMENGDCQTPLVPECGTVVESFSDFDGAGHGDGIGQSQKFTDGQLNSFNAGSPDVTQLGLASLYFRAGSPQELEIDGENSQRMPCVFDDTSSSARSSNIFGDTKSSDGALGDHSGNRLSHIFVSVDNKNHKISLGMPCDLESPAYLGYPDDRDSVQLSASDYDDTYDGVLMTVRKLSTHKCLDDIPETPMYTSEKVSGVTELAFHTPLTDLCTDPLRPHTHDLFGADLPSFDTEEFVSAGDMLDKLDEDEKQFEKDNVFIQDAMMHNLSQLQDEFSFHSNPFSQPPTPDPSASYMSISIGQFMGARTAALGALDGNTHTRPCFGSKIITPPDNRKPVVLLDKTTPTETSSTCPSVSPIPEVIRGSGVGSDVDPDSFEHGDGEESPLVSLCVTSPPLTTPEIPTQTKEIALSPDPISAKHVAATDDPIIQPRPERTSSPDGSASEESLGGSTVRSQVNDSKSKRTVSPNVQDNISTMDQLPESKGSEMTEASQKIISGSSILNDSMPVVNLSTIQNMISNGGDAADLVDYIMQMSQAKSKAQGRQSAQQIPAQVSQTSGTSQSIVSEDHPERHRSGQKLQSDYVRKPADGKSTYQDSVVNSVPSQILSSSREFCPQVLPEKWALLGQSQDKTIERNTSNNSNGMGENISGNCTNSVSASGVVHVGSRDPIGQSGSLCAQIVPEASAQNITNGERLRGRTSSASLEQEPNDGNVVNRNGYEQNIHRRTLVNSFVHSLGKSEADLTSLDKKARECVMAAGLKSRESQIIPGGGENVEDDLVLPPSDSQAPLTIQVTSNSTSESTPNVPLSAVPRRVQFQHSSPSQPISISIPEGLNMNNDCLTPDNVGRPNTRALRTWFSSTPKLPQNHVDMCGGRVSNILGSPQDSFYQDYTEPTFCHHGYGQDVANVEPVGLGAALNDSVRGGDFGSLVKNTVDNCVQSSTQSQKGSLVARTEQSGLGATASTHSTQVEPSIRYDGVFKVPPPPPIIQYSKSPFDESPSLTFLPVKESESLQRVIDESERLQRVNESQTSRKPDEPDSHSFHLDNHDQMPHSSSVIPTIQLTAASQSRPASAGSTIEMLTSISSGRNHGDQVKPTSAPSLGDMSQGVPIEAPGEVRVPGVCCVGLSSKASIPLKNLSSRWLAIDIQLVSLSIDGEDVGLSGNMPFVYKERAILEPSTSEDVRVVFVPRVAGAYVAQLHIVSGLLTDDGQPPPSSQPTMVMLQAIAEPPMIQVVTEGSRSMLDFGAVPWGCQKGRSITLINKGRASVPLRLVISNQSTWYGFTFHQASSPDVSLVSQHSRPDTASLAPVINNLILPAADQHTPAPSVQVVVYFRAPSRRHDQALSMLPPEDFQARLEVEVDIPSSLVSLGAVTLLSTVGLARLHTPVDLEVITMKTYPGRPTIQRVPLRNAGNIPLEVSLEVTHWPDVFTIVPVQLMIEPGGQSEFLVKFEPKESTVPSFESLLLLYVEPDGPGFEMTLCGEVLVLPVLPPLPPPPPRGRTGPVQLLCNKRFLAWGGVPLQKSSSMTLTLKNAADHMMKLLIEILNGSDFKILSSYGHKEKLSVSKEILLRPLEEYPVHVCYTPTQVSTSSAKLQIKKVNSSFKCGIPLSGYGGSSDVTLKGVKGNSFGSHWISIGHPVTGHRLVTTVTVCNHGNRAAYITALTFEDLSCKKRLKDDRKVTVQPQDFCLQPSDCQEVTIAMQASEREAALCTNQAAIAAVVCFYHGDQLSRHLYRRAVKNTARNSHQTKSSQLKEVDFMKMFHNEQISLSEADMKSTPNDSDLFYTAMRHTTLAVVGVPPEQYTDGPTDIPDSSHSKPDTTHSKPNTTHSKSVWDNISDPTRSNLNNIKEKQCSVEEIESFEGAVDHNKLSPEKYRSREIRSPPVRDTKPARKVVSLMPKHIEWTDEGPVTNSGHMNNVTGDNSCWTIEPEQLTLTTSCQVGGTVRKKVQITNFTDNIIRFEVLWPGHCLTVTPEDGHLSARTCTTVYVSVHPELSNTTKLPWSGKIHILCHGQTKVIKVQVHEGVQSEDVQTNLTHTVPAVSPSGVSSSHLLRVKRPQIVFHSTQNKHQTEQQIEFRNVSTCPIKWSVTSFAPPYHKPVDGNAVYRVTYSVFRLTRISGLLEPHQDIKLPVNFTPRKEGRYTQFWEIHSEIIDGNDLDIGRTQTCKLEFQGQCTYDGVSEWKDIQSHRTVPLMEPHFVSMRSIKCMEGLVSLTPDTADFVVHTPGSISQNKIRVGNKSKNILLVDVLQPKRPFSVKATRLEIRPRHYLNLPVEFRPWACGRYQEVLVIRKLSGETLQMNLNGVCK